MRPLPLFVLIVSITGLSAAEATNKKDHAPSAVLPRNEAREYVLEVITDVFGDPDAKLPAGIMFDATGDMIPVDRRQEFLELKATAAKEGRTVIAELRSGTSRWHPHNLGRLPEDLTPPTMREKLLPKRKLANLTAADWDELNIKYAMAVVKRRLLVSFHK